LILGYAAQFAGSVSSYIISDVTTLKNIWVKIYHV